MTTCPECGHRNAPGTQFCTSCQAYLDWDVEGVQEPRGRPGPSGGADTGTGSGTRSGTSTGTGTGTRSGTPGVPGPPRRAPDRSASSGGERRAGAHDTESPAVPSVPQRASDVRAEPPAPPAPPPEPSVPPAQAAAAAAPRRPGDDLTGEAGPRHREEEHPPSRPRSSAPQAAATIRTCRRCGTVNPGDRRLCLGCHGVLDPARAAVAPSAAGPLPWWRRLLGGASEGRMAAGSRPRHRVLPRPRIALPLALLLLVGAAWLFRAQLAGLFDFARDRAGKPEALQVVEPAASSSAPGHSPAAAFDKLSNRYWAPARAGTFTGHYVRASFEKPVRLSKLLITPGTSAKQDQYLKQARPSHVTLTLRQQSGERTTKAIRLKDQAGDQSFDVRGSDVVRVTVAIEDAYGARPGRRPAIAELEFFGRR